MLDKIQRRLFLMNVAVFLSVLSVLSIAVLIYFVHSLDIQAHDELSKLTDSVIASIDFDEVGRHDAGIPDAVAGAVPVQPTHPLAQTCIQWFDSAGKLIAERGHYPITVAFSQVAGFQQQSEPHAVVLTRTALLHGKVIGYVRAVHPLQTRDVMLNQLLLGLIIGITAGALVSAIGIRWLVGQAMTPIIDVVRTLKQFTADASHELANPLMAIKTNSDVALKYAEGMRDTDRAKFQAIHEASQQMETLTHSLLMMARLDEMRKPESPDVVDCTEVCKSIVDDLLQQSQNSIVVKLKFSEPLTVKAIPTDLIGLFGNIIRNAFQYTPAGGTIAIDGRLENREVVVSISDNGIGIDKSDLPQIFKRFWRADKARSRRTGGSGLGLSIAKTITEKYRGSIEVQSELEVGSIFTVRLPAETPPIDATRKG